MSMLQQQSEQGVSHGQHDQTGKHERKADPEQEEDRDCAGNASQRANVTLRHYSISPRLIGPGDRIAGRGSGKPKTESLGLFSESQALYVSRSPIDQTPTGSSSSAARSASSRAARVSSEGAPA